MGFVRAIAFVRGPVILTTCFKELRAEFMTASRLEQWFDRVFNDDEPTHFGSGWWSGIAAVFLGLCGFGAVLVLHFPDLLSSRDFRAAYPMDLMRNLVALVIGVAFLCGVLSMLLRKRKLLGLVGISLALVASLLGGSQVAIEGPVEGSIYLGMDWFLLNLFFLAIIFVPLERAFPRLREQGTFRFGWATDGMYFLVSHLAVQLLTFLTLLPATVLSEAIVYAPFQAAIASQPVWLQVLEIMLIGDIAQYWLHRGFHQVSWLWPFHAIHHSSRHLDWLAGSRLHLVDVLVVRSLVLLPIFLLGFTQSALYTWLVIIAVHAIFNHVNLRFRLKWIEQLLVTPRFHYWHHAVKPIDRNFAVHFPWLDRLFGTYHLPVDGSWPDELGIHQHPVPEGFLPQLVYPLRHRRQTD